MNELNPKGRERIICYCMGITAGEIIDTIEDGANTLEAIMDETSAGTVCGNCHRKINGLLEEHKK